MKKNIKLIVLIIILLIITCIMYYYAFINHSTSKQTDYSNIEKYIKDIYGTTFLIPEFDNINDATEDWLWENVNQYVWNHDDDYHEKNEQEYGYTYEDISKIVNHLYGSNLKKKFPEGAVSMRYNSYRNLYGPTSFGITNYYDYKIENITQENTNYIVSLYDYTISNEDFLGKDSPDGYFEIFNNYDFLINKENGTPIIKVKSLDDKKFKNILDEKNKLSHKILTIKYDESDNSFHIISCKYAETKNQELLATMYNKVQNSFEIMSIDYNYEDIYTQDEVIVNNFKELTSIYTENALKTYKNEMDILVYKDNGDVYITAGDITIGDYIIKIEFDNIEVLDNKITCQVIRTLRKNFNPSTEEYNEIYKKENTFTILKVNEQWLVDEFSYNS